MRTAQSWLGKVGLALLVLSLFLPWMHIILAPGTGGNAGPFSPLVVVLFGYPIFFGNCLAGTTLLSCTSEAFLIFVVALLPFFSALYFAAYSIWRSPMFGTAALASAAAVVTWAYWGWAAGGGSPVYDAGPDVGLYVAAVGNLFLLCAWAAGSRLLWVLLRNRRPSESVEHTAAHA